MAPASTAGAALAVSRHIARQGPHLAPICPPARLPPYPPLSPPDNVCAQVQQLRIGQLLCRLRHQFPRVLAGLQVPIQHPATLGGQHCKVTPRGSCARARRQAQQRRARKAASIQLRGEKGGGHAGRWESGEKSTQLARATTMTGGRPWAASPEAPSRPHLLLQPLRPKRLHLPQEALCVLPAAGWCALWQAPLEG